MSELESIICQLQDAGRTSAGQIYLMGGSFDDFYGSTALKWYGQRYWDGSDMGR